MAIPASPSSFNVQQANGQVLVTSDLSVGATSYVIQRSTDNVTFNTLATVVSPSYIDTTVLLGVQYWYQIAAINGSGISIYTSAQSAIPTPTGEMSLAQVRLQAQQRADRVNSDFVTVPEWNTYINQAAFELYDLLVKVDSDTFIGPTAQFSTDGSTFLYPLPNGVLYNAAPSFYKLTGVDLNVNNAANAWVTLKKFNFIDRNQYVYPNSAGTLYGVFNMRYRLVGSNIEFTPTPSSNQIIRLWYIPRLTQMLADTDLTSISISGWIEYVIVRAAKYALDKEESDTTKLDAQLVFLKGRIEESAQNRDQGQADTISNTRQSWNYGGDGGWGWNSPIGGV